METQLVATVCCYLDVGFQVFCVKQPCWQIYWFLIFSVLFFSCEFGFACRLLVVRGNARLLVYLYSVESELCIRGY